MRWWLGVLQQWAAGLAVLLTVTLGALFVANYRATQATLKAHKVPLSGFDTFIVSLRLPGLIVAVCLLLILYAVILLRVSWKAGTRTDPLPAALGLNPLDAYFERRQIRITDLLLPGADTIRSKTFKDCHIQGPAMIAFDRIEFEFCTWNGAPDAIFVAVPANTRIMGALAVRNCKFVSCSFTQISTFGTKEQMDSFKAQIQMRQ